MKKIFLILIGVINFSVLSKAQDSIVVYDLTVTLNSQVHGTGLDSISMDSSGVQLSAIFRLNAPENTDSIFVKLGLLPNGSEFNNNVFNVVSHSPGAYCMHSGVTEVCAFRAKAVAYTAVLAPINVSDVHWVTVYAKDNLGNYSEKKYFKIR